MELLVKRVEQHPDTMFYFFYPPYSMLWWDNMYRSGEQEQVMYAAGTSAERLLGYENVRMYYFQNDRDIILDLDQYMDPVHFTAEINQYMVEQMKEVITGLLRKITGKSLIKCGNWPKKSGKRKLRSISHSVSVHKKPQTFPHVCRRAVVLLK